MWCSVEKGFKVKCGVEKRLRSGVELSNWWCVFEVKTNN